MAFLSAVIKRYRGVLGRYSLVIGTYTNTAGSIGGDIDTKLTHCHFIKLLSGGGAVVLDEPVVNESFAVPIRGNAVTIVTTADADGYFIAFGT